MKILYIIPTLRKGGAERLVMDICNELNTRKDVEARILLLHDRNDFSGQLQNTEVLVTTSYFRFRITEKSHADFSDYKSLVSSFLPDIINSHLFESEFFSREILFPGVRYFSHLHDRMIQFHSLTITGLFSKRTIINRIEKKHLIENYRNCKNHFIANSNHTANFFKKHLPADLRKNLTVLPNAIDIKSFPFFQREFPKKILHLVTTGSLVTKKNHAFLLKVTKILKEKNHTVHLTILGEGILRRDLEMEASHLEISELVFFAGNVHDIAGHLNGASVYVHTAIYEPFGLAILEAMSTGLPVVAYNAGGNSEFLKNGVTGFLLEELNPELFADKILEIVRSEEAYRQFSFQTHKAASQFGIKEYVNRLISLYEDSISSN